MKRIVTLLVGVVTMLSSLTGNAQAYYIGYDEWQDKPHVFPEVLMFTADWCGPSEAMKKTINKLALEYVGRVVFYFVDIDDEPEWAAAWRCPVLPTTYFIYESDIANDDYKWMAQKSSLPISKLRDNINWMLSNWKLSNLPEPISIKDADDDTDYIQIMSAALGGDVESMATLGDWLSRPDNVMWNYLASQNGHAEATYRLGWYFLSFPASETRGRELLKEAAERGSLVAIETLIDAYSIGCYGFSPNSEREYYYRRLKSQFQ